MVERSDAPQQSPDLERLAVRVLHGDGMTLAERMAACEAIRKYAESEIAPQPDLGVSSPIPDRDAEWKLLGIDRRKSAQDADRYRVLRDDPNTPVWVSEANEWGKQVPLTGEALDKALDEYNGATPNSNDERKA